MATKHKFVLFGTGANGIQWRSIFYYSTAADFTPTEAEMQAWANAYWGLTSLVTVGGYSIYGIGYSPYTGSAPEVDPKGWGATVVYPVTGNGAASGESLPTQSAWVLIGRTATKRVMAKKFLLGVSEAGQNAGVATGGSPVALANIAGFIYASTYSMGGTALTPGAWGRRHGFTPTITATVSPFIGSQRRRKPGIGI